MHYLTKLLVEAKLKAKRLGRKPKGGLTEFKPNKKKKAKKL